MRTNMILLAAVSTLVATPAFAADFAGPRVEGRLGHAHLDAHRGHGVGHQVVELPGDAHPLGVDPPPGLALALLRPDLRVTLVEPLAKRLSFLRTVLGTLGRTDIELRRERVEDVVQKSAGAWDVAMSRATLAPAAWVPVALKLAPAAWTLLAREEPPAVAGAHVDEDIAYAWPLTGAARRAVRFVRD